MTENGAELLHMDSVDGLLMDLDGSYCFPTYGKVNDLIGCWRKHLNIAKDAP